MSEVLHHDSKTARLSPNAVLGGTSSGIRRWRPNSIAAIKVLCRCLPLLTRSHTEEETGKTLE